MPTDNMPQYAAVATADVVWVTTKDCDWSKNPKLLNQPKQPE